MRAPFNAPQLKRVYFVRHGVTDANEVDAFQTFETPLSTRGLEQAKFLAKRFTAIPIERIITSPMLRARETAHEIGTVAGCAITESPLFQEIIRPSVIHGRSKEDPEVNALYEQLVANFANPAWRHSDEENFFALKARAEEALRSLEAQPEHDLAVVTHGTFLQMLITAMWDKGDASFETFSRIEFFLHTENTGITKCVLTTYGWRLWSWNDSAHLGEVG